MIVAINSEKSCVLEGTRVPEGGVEKSHICNSFILLNYKKKVTESATKTKSLRLQLQKT